MKFPVITALVAALATLPLVACTSSGMEPGVAVDSSEPFSEEVQAELDAAAETAAAREVERDQSKRLAAEEALARAAEEAARAVEEEERLQAIRAVPKRSASDLLVVAICPVQGAEELWMEDGELFDFAFYDAFIGHVVVRMVDEDRVAEAWDHATATGSPVVEIPADVLVSPSSSREGDVVTLRASIASAYSDVSYDFDMDGTSIDELLPRFVAEVERIVLELIGPTLPANSDHLRREEHLEAGDKRALLRRRARDEHSD